MLPKRGRGPRGRRAGAGSGRLAFVHLRQLLYMQTRSCSVWNRLCQPFQNFLLPEILHLCCFVTVDELVLTSIEVSQPGRTDCVVLDLWSSFIRLRSYLLLIT